MSKIGAYKAAKAIAERLARDADKCLGRDRQDNDKHRAKAEFERMDDSSWLRGPPMLISIELGHGYYGSSEAYSDTSAYMGRYLAKAITQHMPALLDTAVALVRAEAEAARKEAEAEARAVLEDSAT